MVDFPEIRIRFRFLLNEIPSQLPMVDFPEIRIRFSFLLNEIPSHKLRVVFGFRKKFPNYSKLERK